MLMVQAQLTPEHYASAVRALVMRTDSCLDADVLTRADNWLSKWSIRVCVLVALLSVLVVSIITTGPTSILSIIALLAVPLGLALCIACERACSKLDRFLDARINSFGERELIERIKSGSLNVHLGQIRIELDEHLVRTTIAGETTALAWPEIKLFAHTDEVAILCASNTPNMQTINDAVIIPLTDAATREATLEIIRKKSAAR